MRPCWLLILVGALAAAASPALADPVLTADDARRAEERLDYDVAADLWMMVITDETSTDAQRFEAHLRAGIIQRIRNNDTAARLHFQQALELRPDHTLDDSAPPKVRGFFDMVKQERLSTQPAPAAAPAAVPAPAAPVEVDATPWTAIAVTGGGAAVVGLGALVGALALALLGGAFVVDGQALATGIQLERKNLYDLRDGLAAGSVAAGAIAVLGLAVGGAVATGGGIWWVTE